MSIENCGTQFLEPRRGDMCKTFPRAGSLHSVKVILKSTIVIHFFLDFENPEPVGAVS